MRTRPNPLRSPDDDVFWAHVACRELRLQRCPACDRFRYPPAPCCPECLGADVVWERVSGRARAVSWVRFHRAYFPALPPPYVVVSVELEEGPLMVGNLDDDAAARLTVGAPLRLVFEDCRFEDGSPGVVPQWELARPTTEEEIPWRG